MVDCSELFIGMDVSKDRHAVAVADGGREGEVRYYGEIGSDAASVRRLVRKLERSGARLRFCYEAGPTRYGLERLMYSVVATLKTNGIDVRRWLETWFRACAENGGRPPEDPSPWLPWSMSEERRRALMAPG